MTARRILPTRIVWPSAGPSVGRGVGIVYLSGRRASHVPYLDHVALEFPELRIVAGHIGFPWVFEMISLATKYPNVYIDTSAYKVRRYPRDLVEYLRGHGRKKVLFGSNHPAWPAKECLEDFETLDLDTETEALFLYKNAE